MIAQKHFLKQGVPKDQPKEWLVGRQSDDEKPTEIRETEDEETQSREGAAFAAWKMDHSKIRI